MGSGGSAMDSGSSRTVRVITAEQRGPRGFTEVEFGEGTVSTSKASKKKTKRDKEDERLQALVDQALAESRGQATESSQPQYTADDELAMETYYHNSGQIYSCVYQGGQRFYLDSWESQDWQAFPDEWLDEGVIVTESIMKSDGSGAMSYDYGTGTDDREGYLEHPVAGTLSTYLFEETRNVHYYFDKETGSWIRLPISWELRSELIQKLLQPIKESLPDWVDQQDMLAALRCSNYDPHETIGTYLTVAERGHLPMPRNAEDAKILKDKDDKIAKMLKRQEKLKRQLDKANRQLEDERAERRAAENQVYTLKEKVSELQVALSGQSNQMEAIQREYAEEGQKKRPALQEKVDTRTVKELNQIVKHLHKEYVKIKMEAETRFQELQQFFKQITVGMTKIQLYDSDMGKEVEQMRELYRREALQRKLLYNKLQEMRGNIRVFCRCRYDDEEPSCIDFPTDVEIHPQGGKKHKFDKVFQPTSTQEEVFEEAKPIIMSCVDGYNVCILAYGQTGSGKTHTMMGPAEDPGVNIRAITELLKICQERENVRYSLTASMVEIYNETIIDLFTSEIPVLEIRMQGNKVVMPGLTEMMVETMEDVQQIMELGDMNRSQAATKMNSQSSRSHLLLMVTVEGRDQASGATTTGTLTLVDLAGSERVSKTEAAGQRLIEAAAINKSLTALGQVFSSLRTGQLHIPYRNSKLTHVLQPSLGGDAKACLFVMVSPLEYNVQETISTLNFGANARQVKLGEAKKHVRHKQVMQNTWGVEDA